MLCIYLHRLSCTGKKNHFDNSAAGGLEGQCQALKALVWTSEIKASQQIYITSYLPEGPPGPQEAKNKHVLAAAVHPTSAQLADFWDVGILKLLAVATATFQRTICDAPARPLRILGITIRHSNIMRQLSGF